MTDQLLRPRVVLSGVQMRPPPLLRGSHISWGRGRSWVKGRGRPIATNYTEADESQVSYLPAIE